MEPQDIFNSLSSLDEYSFLNGDKMSAACTGNRLKDEVISNIYPTIDEDLSMLRGIWDVIGDDYLTCDHADTDVGKAFIEIIEDDDRLDKCQTIVYHVRSWLYQRCNKLQMMQLNLGSEQYAEYVSSIRMSNQARSSIIVTRDLPFVTDDPAGILDYFSSYYHSRGYATDYGYLYRKDSPLALARQGLIPLTPEMFNFGIAPWIVASSIRGVNAKHELNNLGWKRDNLISALVASGVPEAAKLKTKSSVVTLYRKSTNSDVHVDFDMMVKHRLLARSDLVKISVSQFNLSRETLPTPNLLKELKYLREVMLNTKNTVTAIVQASSYQAPDGSVSSGWHSILSKEWQHTGKSIWIFNHDSTIILTVAGIVIPSQMIPCSYYDYLWACSNIDSVSLYYLAYIAQRLGLWSAIKHIHESEICSIIDTVLTK